MTDAEILDRIVVRCMACEARFTGAEALSQCPACGGLLDVVIPTRRKLTPSDFGVGVPAAASTPASGGTCRSYRPFPNPRSSAAGRETPRFTVTTAWRATPVSRTAISS